jgi:ABC-type nitrate/sulfonate/bicarbonate transport system permease component
MRALAHTAFPVGVGLLGLAAVAAALEAATATGLVSPLIVAPPSRLPGAFVKLWAEGQIGQSFLATLAQALAATALAVLVGLPLGILLWRRPVLGAAYETWLGAAFAAPIVLLYPLFLVIFGRGYTTIVIVGAIAAAIPVTLKTREGLRGVPPVLVNVARSFHADARTLFMKVVLPAAAPAIFTGVRLGLIYALVNIIGIEFLIDFGGLGRLVSDTYYRYDIPGMYVAILLIVVVSLLFLAALARAERWLRPR